MNQQALLVRRCAQLISQIDKKREQVVGADTEPRLEGRALEHSNGTHWNRRKCTDHLEMLGVLHVSFESCCRTVKVWSVYTLQTVMCTLSISCLVQCVKDIIYSYYWVH